MFKYVNNFKLLIIWLQVLALSFYSAVGSAQSNNSPISNERQLELFLSTEEIQTEKGPARIEVRSFEINNEQDLENAKSEILQKTFKDYKTGQFFVMGVKSSNYKETSLDQSVQKSVTEIETSLNAETKVKPEVLTANDPNKVNFFKKNYNITLGFVRFVANAATVSTGLIIGKGVSPEHALLVGTLAGALSGIIQVKSDALFKWLSNSVLLVKAAKKAGLIPDKDTRFVRAAEKTLKEAEMYGRWASLETGFLLICQTAMSILNIPVAENIFLTVAKSTLSQGIFEVGVLKATKELEKMNPRWASKAAVFKNVSLFAGSSISVLAAIGSMIGMPFANLGFVVLTTSGLVLNFSSKISEIKSLDTLLRRWKIRPATIIRCETLFN